MSSAVQFWGGERGGSAYVHVNRELKQPAVFNDTKLTGEEPVVVAEWEISEFVWWTQFLDELPEVYLQLLELLNIDREEYSTELQGFYAYHHRRDSGRRCDVKRIFLPIVRCGKYHPYASVKHRRRASCRALDRLEFLENECRKRHVKFDYLIKIDLTLPKQVSELWSSRKVERCIRKAVRDFLCDLHNELYPNYNSQFGAISNHHYWASKSPLTPHRHVHLTIPNICYNKRSDTFHRVRPLIPARLIKGVWKRCLKRNGLWPDVPDHVDPDCYIQYVKFSDRNKVIHRLSYCSRKPVEDLVTNLSELDLDVFDEGFARFLLDYTPRIVNLGFLTNLKRFGYSHKRRAMNCPICGGEMYVECDEFGRALLFDRPPPDIPKLYQNRQGLWRKG